MEITGSRSAPHLATTATLPIAEAMRQTIYLAGDGAPLALGGTPAIQAGTENGQELFLFGTDDTNTLLIPEAGAGLILNGDCLLRDGSSLALQWSAADSVWSEVGRNDI